MDFYCFSFSSTKRIYLIMSIFLLFVSDIYDFFWIQMHSDFCHVVMYSPLLIYVVSNCFYQLDVYQPKKVLLYFVLGCIFFKWIVCIMYPIFLCSVVDGSNRFFTQIYFICVPLSNSYETLCCSFVQWSCGCWLAEVYLYRWARCILCSSAPDYLKKHLAAIKHVERIW